MGKNIGFVSTRFAGTDGVSLEAAKWAQLLWDHQHVSYWFAGELDRHPDISMLVPEAFFDHEENQWINKRVFGVQTRTPYITGRIHALRDYLKIKLYEFIERFRIEILIIENAITIPMHVPLGLAITELAAESGIPVVAHHHDFYWERTRFSINAVQDYLQMAFPPKLPNIQHVVINSLAQEALALRTGISSIVIPNVLDFETDPEIDWEFTKDFRAEIGVSDEDILILQPTRVVQRKGIEHAIELVHELGDPKYKLIISHAAGDEGFEYLQWLQDYAADHQVDMRLISHYVSDKRGYGTDGQKCYSLWDVYPHCDFVTYPSTYEGFGNAFLEAIYFRKPLLVNRYDVFVRDIEPQGFDVVVMDGYVSDRVVEEVREVLESPERRERMVNHNYEVAKRHYSYSVLRKRLAFLISNFFGIEI
ncbi:Glycosyltransferase involved in cell wall bisynthesis [Desulfacinum hydrothermale DSM 13146]|uniref:Glycosyltransferase involved in cell wall bisynthesis n=1 Tax=Desulfacinum hydrothermale DSM 13146 TaxID=1121390 RepID=A0A1W1XT56_9BACT|nr:glycosyltransferase family 4 protein [Desulfacinum hydrothermale]SMC27160.1 Glycosyltransferase involved in cell wall bisynthesis [Desulfacinum hydrothermale DSM 13146]